MCKKILSLAVAFGIIFAVNIKAYGAEGVFLEGMTCESAVLMEQSTGKILLEKNSRTQTAPASITKIMTMLLIIEALNRGDISLEDMVPVSENAKMMGGSEIFLAVGEEMSLHDMLKGIAVASANDAAVAVAEYMCGTEQSFVERMNLRALELGMEGTHYVNCHGLDEEGHYTTAMDVAIVTRELMKHDKIKEYTTIWMDNLRNGKTELVNTNRLIRFYKGATGLKTGTTENAGHCLSATATRDNLDLIAVVMNCQTGTERFAEATSILDYGFGKYANVNLPEEAYREYEVPVLSGEREFVKVKSNAPQTFFTEKSRRQNIEVRVNLKENATAPVEKNQIMGNIELVQNDEIIGSYSVFAEEYVEKRSLFDSFKTLWKSFAALC